jgi:hypothetical protein
MLRADRAAGNPAHDAHVAVLCVENGVSELRIADRELNYRFPGIAVHDPFNS